MKTIKITGLIILFLSFKFSFSQVENDNVNLKEKVYSEIIVYGSDTCHYCIDTKSFLIEKKIKFTYFDIDKNNERLNEMLKKLKGANIPTSNLNLPVIDKGGIIFTNDGVFESFLLKLIE